MKAGSLVASGSLFVILWSSGWIVSRFAVDELSAMTLLTARYVIVFIALVVLVSVLGNWRRLNSATIVCHLFIGVLSHAAFLLAGVGSFELGVSAGLVAFVTALQPMITAVLSSPITQERATRQQWQGLVLGLVATVLLVSGGYHNGLTLYALFLPFVAVVSLTLGTLLHKRMELQNSDQDTENAPVTLLLLIHSVGALTILLPISASHGLVHFNFTTSQWIVVLWLALVISLGAYGLLLILLRNLPCMKVASLSYLVPPVTMLQSYLVFDHPINLMDTAGLCIAAVGVYLVMKPVSCKEATISPLGVLAASAVVRNRLKVDIEL